MSDDLVVELALICSTFSVVKEINKINDLELELGVSGSSWHDDYKGAFSLTLSPNIGQTRLNCRFCVCVRWWTGFRAH
jgi:hypothetical protein